MGRLIVALMIAVIVSGVFIGCDRRPPPHFPVTWITPGRRLPNGNYKCKTCGHEFRFTDDVFENGCPYCGQRFIGISGGGYSNRD